MNAMSGAAAAVFSLSAALACAGYAYSQAGDIRAGKQLAIGCQGCHGMDGLSKQPDAPNLAAQPAIYLIKSLKEYKTKQRRHEQMNVAAEGLSDKDIENVSAYYAAIEIEVVKRPE